MTSVSYTYGQPYGARPPRKPPYPGFDRFSDPTGAGAPAYDPIGLAMNARAGQGSYAALAGGPTASTFNSSAPNQNSGVAPVLGPSMSGSPGSSDPSAGIDYTNDPILAKIKALATADEQNAESGAIALRKQQAIDLGDPELAGKLGLDQSTIDAAGQNPLSYLKRLSVGHDLRGTQLDENLNKSNLFYSGFRGQQLGLEGQRYLGEQAGANSFAQGNLSGIEQNLLAARSNAQQRKLAAQEAAYNRSLARGTAPGGSGGAAGGGGAPPGGDTNPFGPPNPFGDPPTTNPPVTAAADSYLAGYANFLASLGIDPISLLIRGGGRGAQV